MNPSQSFSKNVQRVQDALIEKNVQFHLVQLPESAHTAQQAATALGCEIAQIVKSLIFKTRLTDLPILVLASGPNRVNEKLIEAQIGENIIKADANFTREVTGFAIGGIPPLGHTTTIQTFIDQDLFAFITVWAAAGTPHAVFNFNTADLQSMTNGTIIAIH